MSIVRIKRSQNTHAPTTLEAGELSYSANGDLLYIGRPDGSNTVTAIGGKRTPGILTANQALVTNSTSAIDKIIVANLVATTVTANGGVGTDGQVLSSNGSVSYWRTITVDGVSTVSAGEGLNSTGTNNVTLNVGAGNGISVNADFVAVLAGNSQLVSNATGVWIDQTKIDHNSLANYSANRHIDHSAVSIATANGVAGGGDITTTRNLYVVANNGLLSNSSGVFVVANSGLSTNATGVYVVANNGLSTNATGVYVTAGSGIASNTSGVHVVAGNSQVVSNATGVWLNQAQIDHNSLANYSANRHVDHTAVSIATANGVAGGGDISATRNLYIVANSGLLSNSSGIFVVANNGLSSNAAGVFVTAGGGIASNSTGVHVVAGNSQVVSNSSGVFVNQAQIDHNSLSNYSANRHIDHSAVSISTGSGLTGGGDITATRTLSVIANNGLLSNSSGVFVVANSGLSTNSTGVFVVPGNGLVTANSSGVHVGAGNGISVNTTAVSILANNGVIANSTGLFVNANNGLSVNSTGLFVTGGNGLVSNSSGVHVGAANGITVDADSIRVNGGSTLTVNATGVHVNSSLSITDLTLSGNLTVTGSLVTVDATNLVVNDSIIELARNNGANVLDIGFYGSYSDGAARYTGLIWDTSSGNYELFANTTSEPSTTLDTAGVGFTRSTLSAYLKSGWGTGTFVANATGVTITANSTYAVSLTANTLSLSTALPATSGGTGWASFTAGDLLTASNTSYLSKLSLGTSGKILQSNGTAVVYDDVDGGTF